MALPATPYILRDGETPASVAATFGLTAAQLQTFNQLRTFRVPFAQLHAGDEIDVPVMRARGSLQAAGTGTAPDAPAPREEDGATRLADNAQTLGGLLENSRTGGAAAGMARSMATGALNGTVQDWLSKFGTAKVSLSVDDNGRLDNSSLDWLVPLYDTPQNMLFIQTGARNRDSRNTLNAGWGVRWFTPHWMYGFNNFYDNDITGNNRRVGLGAEARTDYLQFAGNTYLRLSDWHQSRDFADYDERPANGYDLRAQGWLPAYPQLGGKLVWEQYYGNEVALFGKDNRQHNPYAVTAGLSWTPFPLLTLGVDQRMGKGGQNETSMNVQLTWRPGDSLSSQLSSESVGASRLLESSRYDLVDRNNNIVLDYRKQELVSVSLNTYAIRATAGSSQVLTGIVKSKYGVKGLTVTGAEFTAAGGTLTATDSTHVKVTLPAYRTTQFSQAAKAASAPSGTDLNTYTLTATAADLRGNTSAPKTVSVTVLPPVLSIDGTLQVSHDNMPADGSSAITVTALIGDSNGHAVADQQITFTTTYADGSTDTQTAVTDERGLAPVDITSKVAGPATVKVTAGSVSKTVTLTFVATDISAAKSSLTVSPAGITADGKSAATLTLTARDVAGNAVTGKASALTFPVTGVSSLSVTGITESPAGSGIYRATLSGTEAGTATLSPALNGSTTGGLSAQLVLTPDSATAGVTALTTESNNATADGTATNSVKATVKDANGNLVPDAPVTFTADNGAVIAATGVTGPDGTVTVTLTSTTAGTSTVTATAAGGHGLSTQTTFSAGSAVAANSALSADKGSITADGATPSALTLILKDIHGNAAAGRAVVFNSSLKDVSFSAVQDHGNGTYTTQLTGTFAGTADVTVTVNGSALGLSTSVTLTAGAPVAANSTLTATPDTVTADNTAFSTLLLTLRDAHNNPVSGQTVDFTSALPGSHAGTATGNGSGAYTATLTGTRAGTTTLTTRVGGSDFAVSSPVVTFVAGVADASKSTLTATPSAITANGTSAATVTLTLKDANGNPVTGQTVEFASTLGGITFTSVQGNADGTYTATLTGTRSGPATLSATVGGAAFGGTATVTLTPDNVSARVSALEVVTNNATADGTATNSVKATVRDVNDNLLPGITVNFSAGNGAVITGTGVTGEDGTVTVTLTSTTSGAGLVTAAANGSNVSVTATFVPGSAVAANATLSADRASITADGTTVSTLTLTLKDAHNNLVYGKGVRFLTDLAGSAATPATDNNNGTYTASLTGTKTGTAHITVEVGGSAFAVTPVSVTLTPGAPVAAKSVLAVSPASITADNTATSTLTLTLKDAQGNLVPGQSVDFFSDLVDSGADVAVDRDDGTYTALLKGTKTGTANITVTVDGAAYAVNAASVTLTAGVPVAANSTLTASPDSITADGTTASVLTLALKDANMNPVSGQAVTFVSSLSNSGAPSVTDNHDGTYTASLTGTTSGTAHITVQVGGSAFAVTPASVTLTPGEPTSVSSTLSANPASITADGASASTLTLKLNDAQGNPVPGQKVTFESSLSGVDFGDVTDINDGSYTIKITGTTVGTSVVTANVAGTSVHVSTNITLTDVSSFANTLVSVNGTTYKGDGGFPTTGFTGAKFQILLDGDDSKNTDYTWNSDQTWVTVDTSGNVQFIGAATSGTRTVKITATPVSGGASFTYEFTVTKWFTPQSGLKTWSQANTLCKSSLPDVSDLTNQTSTTAARRSPNSGALMSEWGSLNLISGSGFSKSLYWTSTISSTNYPGYYYIVNAFSWGNYISNSSSNSMYPVCMINL
ncbi:invasin domain 3-containing protein [Enterobacter cloacae]